MASNWAKPLKGKHVFVVLRHDDFIDDPIESTTGTKATSNVACRIAYEATP